MMDLSTKHIKPTTGKRTINNWQRAGLSFAAAGVLASQGIASPIATVGSLNPFSVSSASAAELSTVTVSQPVLTVNGAPVAAQVSTTGNVAIGESQDYTIKGTAQAGDTFKITVGPSVAPDAPVPFPVKDSAGTIIGTAIAQGQDIIVTLNQAAAGRIDITGSINVALKLTTNTPTNTPFPVVTTVNGVTQSSVQNILVPKSENPMVNGISFYPTQGANGPTAGVFGTTKVNTTPGDITVTMNAATGTTFNCASYPDFFQGGPGKMDALAKQVYTGKVISCTPTSITVTVLNVPAGEGILVKPNVVFNDTTLPNYSFTGTVTLSGAAPEAIAGGGSLTSNTGTGNGQYATPTVTLVATVGGKDANTTADQLTSTTASQPVMLTGTLTGVNSDLVITDQDSNVVAEQKNVAPGPFSIAASNVTLTETTKAMTYTVKATNVYNSALSATASDPVNFQLITGPKAVDDSSTTPWNTPSVAYPVMDNDLPGNFGTLVGVSPKNPEDLNAAEGTWTIVDNKPIFTPNPTTRGPVSINLLLTDSNGLTAEETYTVTVGDPVATLTNDSATTEYDTAVTLQIFSNDNFPSVFPLDPSTAKITTAGNGGVIAEDEKSVVYTDDKGNTVTVTLTAEGAVVTPKGWTGAIPETVYTVTNFIGTDAKTATINVTVGKVPISPTPTPTTSTPSPSQTPTTPPTTTPTSPSTTTPTTPPTTTPTSPSTVPTITPLPVVTTPAPSTPAAPVEAPKPATPTKAETGIEQGGFGFILMGISAAALAALGRKKYVAGK